MVFKYKRAQSTLEYMVILTGIIGVIIWAASTLVKDKINQAYTDVKTSIENTASEIAP